MDVLMPPGTYAIDRVHSQLGFAVTHLDISENKLNSEGVVALVESGGLSGLRVLNLSRTMPGVPGIEALADASSLAGLRSLDLSPLCPRLRRGRGARVGN